MPPRKHAHATHPCYILAPYHACGLGVEVFHDVLNAVFDIFQELLSHAWFRVQLRNAEMNAGRQRRGEKGDISHLVYIQQFSSSLASAYLFKIRC